MKRVFARLCLVIFFLEVLLFLLSWLISVIVPQWEINSLLTDVGIRWAFRHAESSLLSPPLVWLMLVAIAWGAVKGLRKAREQRKYVGGQIPTRHRERIAAYSTLITAIIYIVVIVMLTLMPNAPLASITGSLFPSAFSQSLAAILCVGVCLCSYVYGIVSGIYSDAIAFFESVISGIADFSPLFLFYVLTTHLITEITYIL